MLAPSNRTSLHPTELFPFSSTGKITEVIVIRILEKTVVSENKTKPTEASVTDFIEGVDDEVKRADSYTLIELMEKHTGKPPVMWGPTMIGFDTVHYEYESGHAGDMFLVGFSPRKAAISLYLMCNLEEQTETLAKLGKHKIGKACLYVKRLSDIDLKVLEKLIKQTVKTHRKK